MPVILNLVIPSCDPHEGSRYQTALFSPKMHMTHPDIWLHIEMELPEFELVSFS
jgi:hypothetical protein